MKWRKRRKKNQRISDWQANALARDNKKTIRRKIRDANKLTETKIIQHLLRPVRRFQNVSHMMCECMCVIHVIRVNTSHVIKYDPIWNCRHRLISSYLISSWGGRGREGVTVASGESTNFIYPCIFGYFLSTILFFQYFQFSQVIKTK